jgi:hypothetical protein
MGVDDVDPNGVTIVQQPKLWAGNEGSPATFNVVATSGDASPLTYQWQEYTTNWANTTDAGTLSGSTTDTLTIAPTVITDHNRVFRVKVTNSTNTVTSNSATLWIVGAVWFILDEAGNRTVTETLLDDIVDERSV